MNEKIMKQEATYDWLKDEVHCLYEQNKNLKEDYKRHIDRINELTNRIDKAIEYISEYRNGWNNWFEFTIDDKLKLLDILKGSDSNE